MKYPELKKKTCYNDHSLIDVCDCGDCIRNWEAKCKEFESKYESYQKRVKCGNCFGSGYRSTTYGQAPCEECERAGYVWVEKWRHKKATN